MSLARYLLSSWCSTRLHACGILSGSFAVCLTRHQEEKDLRQVRTIKYQTVDTKKDGVKFRTPELKVLGDKYDQLHKEYLERQVDLSKDLIAVACTSS